MAKDNDLIMLNWNIIIPHPLSCFPGALIMLIRDNSVCEMWDIPIIKCAGYNYVIVKTLLVA